jgi:RNA polymerase sigma-70 factor, ECF subfamily
VTRVGVERSRFHRVRKGSTSVRLEHTARVPGLTRTASQSPNDERTLPTRESLLLLALCVSEGSLLRERLVAVISARVLDTYGLVDRREWFEELYRAHAGVVRAFAYRRTASSAADDVVAEVFLVVWRRLGDVPADPLPWLLGTARRVLANRHRGEGRSHALWTRLAEKERHRSGVELESSIARDSAVLHALGSLSERDQEVLVLIAWDGLDRAQAAAVLGVSTGAFAVRLHRARRRLAKALEAIDAGASGVDERSWIVEVLR